MTQEEKIQDFINNFKFDKNLIFTWLPWRWKTHIMKLLYEKCRKNTDWLYRFFIDDGRFKEKINAWTMILMPPEKTTKDALKYDFEMCVRAEVLFFDDLGSSENVSEAQKTKLKYILDEREKKWLITIFSTNLTPKELSELYGERIKSRIFNWKHKKGLLIIEITWEDRRRENIEKLSF